MKTKKSIFILASFFPVLGCFILLSIGRLTGNNKFRKGYNSLDNTIATCGVIIIHLKSNNDQHIIKNMGGAPVTGNSYIAPADNVVYSEPGIQAGHGQPKRIV